MVLLQLRYGCGERGSEMPCMREATWEATSQETGTDSNLIETQGTPMKYCIGCKHLDLMPGYTGAGGGTYTGPGSHFDPRLLCSKEHWDYDITDSDYGQGANIVDIEKEMRRAESCPDYEERGAGNG